MRGVDFVVGINVDGGAHVFTAESPGKPECGISPHARQWQFFPRPPAGSKLVGGDRLTREFRDEIGMGALRKRGTVNKAIRNGGDVGQILRTNHNADFFAYLSNSGIGGGFPRLALATGTHNFSPPQASQFFAKENLPAGIFPTTQIHHRNIKHSPRLVLA